MIIKSPYYLSITTPTMKLVLCYHEDKKLWHCARRTETHIYGGWGKTPRQARNVARAEQKWFESTNPVAGYKLHCRWMRLKLEAK